MRFDVCVVGLGYVGLPLAQEACRSGLRVAGFDVNQAVVSGLGAGVSHIDDISDDDIKEMVHAGFVATTDDAVLGESDTIVICVPTPLSEGAPFLGHVLSVAERISTRIAPGALVVLESTTYPGTTDEVVRPILERGGRTTGRDFNLVFSPERIDPGNKKFGFRNTPKVVGGATPACTDRGVAFYGRIVDVVVAAKGTREAELAKLLENTYRHVNIALVNEMAKFCHDLNIDLWDVIRCASTKPFGFQAFYPGPGVGGHCIPIDPNYLSYAVRTRLGYPFRSVELAQEMNQSMPAYVARRAQDLLNACRKPVAGSKIVLLGVTYKPNISDERESPAIPLGNVLLELGAELAYVDPHVPEWWPNRPLGASLRSSVLSDIGEADLVILVQAHGAFDLEEVARSAPLLLDTSGRVPEGPNVHRL